jgi:putative DNA primase/helicase
MLELSPDAKAAWITTYNAIEIELRPGGDFELIRDVASKAADNVVRLAALLHVLEHGPDGIVGLSAMNNATSIVAWHLTEARRYFGEHSLPKLMLQAQRLDDWLVGWCRENGTDSIPTRELQRLGPNCLRNRDTLDKVLAELLDANRARIVTEGKQKRVAVNPALLREG